jgi:oligogalacturonide lyase
LAGFLYGIHYYTDPCWIPGTGDRSFVFTSDHENQSNLFRYDLDTGLVTQVTDLQGAGRPGGCVSAANNALYFGWQGEIVELDLETLEERVLWRETAPMSIRGRANPTASA